MLSEIPTQRCTKCNTSNSQWSQKIYPCTIQIGQYDQAPRLCPDCRVELVRVIDKWLKKMEKTE